MSDTAIRVENLGKLYQIGQGQHNTLRETLTRAMSAPFRAVTLSLNGRNALRSEPEAAIREQPSDSLWALRDVSFEIKKGETVGIIGPNGSGKSTLLKLLARITEPTEGEIYINGRVTALIELGAGFHPELTGRENIYLNGAILGLAKKEVDSKFNEIVDFAGLWNFIDTPVKHFSTGMTVRLGFALAVSVEPEILLVDEVLAVGDAAFKKRCFERIDAFIRGGRTIIIVTHNLQEVQRIARRAILICGGTIQADGGPDTVMGSYASLAQESGKPKLSPASSISSDLRPPIEIVKVQICHGDGSERPFFKTHDELEVRINYIAHQPVINPVFRVQMFRSDGLLCHGMNTTRHGVETGKFRGEGTITLRYLDLGLLQGDYSFYVAILETQYDDLPLHQVSVQYAIHVDSQTVDGGGIVAMQSEWIIGKSTSNKPTIHDSEQHTNSKIARQ